MNEVGCSLASEKWYVLWPITQAIRSTIWYPLQSHDLHFSKFLVLTSKNHHARSQIFESSCPSLMNLSFEIWNGMPIMGPSRDTPSPLHCEVLSCILVDHSSEPTCTRLPRSLVSPTSIYFNGIDALKAMATVQLVLYCVRICEDSEGVKYHEAVTWALVSCIPSWHHLSTTTVLNYLPFSPWLCLILESMVEDSESIEVSESESIVEDSNHSEFYWDNIFFKVCGYGSTFQRQQSTHMIWLGRRQILLCASMRIRTIVWSLCGHVPFTFWACDAQWRSG